MNHARRQRRPNGDHADRARVTARILALAAVPLIALLSPASAEEPAGITGKTEGASNGPIRTQQPNQHPEIPVDLLAQAAPSGDSDAALERRLMFLVASIRTASEQEREEILQQLARHEEVAITTVEGFYREELLERMEAVEIIRAIRAQRSDAPATAEAPEPSTDAPTNADAPASRVAGYLVSAASAAEDAEAAYEEATLVDGAVRISGFEIEADSTRARIETLVVRDYAFRDQGGFTADTVEALRGEGVDEDLLYSWETAILDNVVVPTAEELAGTPDFVPMASLRISEMEVRHEDAGSPATVEAVDMQFDDVVDGVPHAFAVVVDRIVLPREALDNPEHQAMLAGLEYDEVVIDAALDVRFDREVEEIDLRRFVLKADEVGRLELAASVGEVRLGALETGDFETLLDSFTLIAAEVSFHNDGAVERGLEMRAEEAGMDPVAFRRQQIDELRAALATLDNPAFEEEMTAAMETFLRDPRALRISASPSSPLSAMQLIGMAMMAPQTLPDMLGLDVTVNE